MIQSPKASESLTLILPVDVLRVIGGAVRPSDRVKLISRIKRYRDILCDAGDFDDYSGDFFILIDGRRCPHIDH